MTHGTSAHGGDLSRDWTDPGRNQANFQWQPVWLRLADTAAPVEPAGVGVLAGLALGLVLITAWQATTDAILHLAIMLAAAAIAATVLLRPWQQPAPLPRHQAHGQAPDEPSRLLAQMHHELRTPLNAMIGFSEVMAAELHGPLGNSRYQEYAAHISASGGRLLKASEDALAVAATMSALAADRRGLRRQSLPVAGLLREAWEGLPARGVRLSVEDRAALEIECDWQTTSQALRHLLGEAAARSVPPAPVVVRCGMQKGTRRVEITAGADAALPHSRQEGQSETGDGVRLMLARSLLEQQGATLVVSAEPHAETWSACIVFPPVPARSMPPHAWASSGASRKTPSEASPRRRVPAHRGDFPAAAAARASAGSRAAHPA